VLKTRIAQQPHRELAALAHAVVFGGDPEVADPFLEPRDRFLVPALEKTGIKTFMVSHDGVVYEKDLGANTSALASAMATFHKDATWRTADE